MCRDIYNGMLYAYLHEHPDFNFKDIQTAARSKARLTLVCKCSIIDKYIYNQEVGDIIFEERKRELHVYLIGDDKTLCQSFPCRAMSV